jgi:biofilm PGA synthesis N-glycosyltransferase PgaC
MEGRSQIRASGPALLLAGAAVAYTYVGYPLLISAIARRRAGATRRDRPTSESAPSTPSMTVVIPAFNESAIVAAKIEDTRRQCYPRGEVEIIVVADGSTDDTAHVAEACGARVLSDPVRRGKSSAVNRGVAEARGDIVVLTDANCALAPGSLTALAVEFADPRVAVVSGDKVVFGDGARGGGEGLYWRYESFVKQAESAIGATSGAPGEIVALRRETFRPIPPHVINDDYHVACDALCRGYDVRFTPTAAASERVSMTIGDEFERRSRIAAGTWQTTLAHMSLAHPREGVRALVFVSHRVMRSVVVPVLLPFLWFGSLRAASHSRIARVLAVLQTAFYGCAVVGGFTDNSALSAPLQFGLTNLATLRGASRFVLGRQSVAWNRAAREGWDHPASDG